MVRHPEDDIYNHCSICIKEECEHIYWKTKLILDRQRNNMINYQNLILTVTMFLSLLAIIIGVLL